MAEYVMNPGELGRVRLSQSARTPTLATPAWLVIVAAACAVAGAPSLRSQEA